VRTPSIAVFLRVHEVVGLPFSLLLPEVRHYVPLQLQLEVPVVSRVISHLLLHAAEAQARFVAAVHCPLPRTNRDLLFLPLPSSSLPTYRAASMPSSSMRSYIKFLSSSAMAPGEQTSFRMSNLQVVFV
jgi:hypothetical protein